MEFNRKVTGPAMGNLGSIPCPGLSVPLFTVLSKLSQKSPPKYFRNKKKIKKGKSRPLRRLDLIPRCYIGDTQYALYWVIIMKIFGSTIAHVNSFTNPSR